MDQPWSSNPNGTSVFLPEYREAIETSCVSPFLLSHSDAMTILNELETISGSNSAVNFEELVTSMICKAFDLSSRKAAKTYHASIPSVDISGNIYQLVVQYSRSLSWEQPYLTIALTELLKIEDSSGLQIILGLIVRGAKECDARKRMVFSTILNRVYKPRGGSENQEDVGSFLEHVAPELAEAFKDSPVLKSSCRRVFDMCLSHVQVMKDKAFESTFMQPTLMYGSVMSAHGINLDADVHGANTYLAFLQASLGINTSRLCHHHDDVKAVVDVAQAGMGTALEALWKDENLGKSWESIRVCKQQRRGSFRSVPHDTFVFPRRRTPKSYADQALRKRSSRDTRRLAVYLRQFCGYFREAFLLPRLFNAVYAGGAGSIGGEEGLGDDLQRLFLFLKSHDDNLSGISATTASSNPTNGQGSSDEEEKMPTQQAVVKAGDAASTTNTTTTTAGDASVAPDCDDVRYWLWDLEASPPTLNLHRARRLFAAIGVVKPSGWVLNPPEEPGEAKKPCTSAPPVYYAPLPSTMIRLSAAGDIRGGGTGREFLSNLLVDGTEPWNKWIHPCTSRSWVQADFTPPEGYVVGRYGLCSANDCPERDPIRWTLRGKLVETGEWMVLHEFPTLPSPHHPPRRSSLPLLAMVQSCFGRKKRQGKKKNAASMGFTRRWQWLWFDLSPPTLPLSSVRLEMECNGSELQLGHFRLQGRVAGGPR